MTLRFLRKLFILTLNKLCQQRWLLAELVLLCLFLPHGIGVAAEHTLTEGVSFSGIRLAVTAPEEDPVPQILEEYLSNMRDIRQYCTFEAMEHSAAIDALEDGEVTAVLVLPESFVQGILWGENPDVTVIVSADHPLESLLTLWVGQSASDFLAAFQSGIYAVLDIYNNTPDTSLTWDQVHLNINLNYSSWTLNRQSIFRTEKLSATETLPIALHYALALLAYLCLSIAPLFSKIYQGDWLLFQRRLRCVGRGSVVGWCSSVLVCILIFLILILPSLFYMGNHVSLRALFAISLLLALFCALWSTLCCLLTISAAGCGLLVFSVSLAALLLSGGILPPVLLPNVFRSLSWLSPVTWFQSLAAMPMGYDVEPRIWFATLLGMACFLALSLWLYHRRISLQEVEA